MGAPLSKACGASAGAGAGAGSDERAGDLVSDEFVEHVPDGRRAWERHQPVRAHKIQLLCHQRAGHSAGGGGGRGGGKGAGRGAGARGCASKRSSTPRGMKEQGIRSLGGVDVSEAGRDGRRGGGGLGLH